MSTKFKHRFTKFTRGAALLAGLALLGAAHTASAQLNATTNFLEGGYLEVITFTDGSGPWTPPTGVTNVAVLVVGGGGGGGSYRAGGGGAGGVIYSNNFAVTPGNALSVTVGAGGQGAVYTNAATATPGNGPGNGTSSVFSTLTAAGGGAGGSRWTIAGGITSANGQNGGSGGGAAYDTPNRTAGAGTQGYGGGACGYAGGGGGGAGAAGGNGGAVNVASFGGAGGLGITNFISGSPVPYAGGGGGGPADNDSSTAPGGAGGSGVGGKGADGASVPSGSGAAGGTPNTGGGGGAGGVNRRDGAAGGSGVVIVRFVVPGATMPTPTQLAFTTVPASGTAQHSFSVTVTAQDAYGFAVNVTSDTTVQLGVASGSGTLSGTTSGVISNGSSSVTISGVIYSVWDTLTLSAATTAGMSLTAATTSIPFVQPASAVVSSNPEFQAVAVNVDASQSVSFNAGVDNPVFGGLTGSGSSLVLTDAVAGCVSLQVGGSGANTEFDGVLSGCGGLTKIGANTFGLGGANTYAGDTVVSNGVLQLLGGSPAVTGLNYFKVTGDGDSGISTNYLYTHAINPSGGSEVVNGIPFTGAPAGTLAANSLTTKTYTQTDVGTVTITNQINSSKFGDNAIGSNLGGWSGVTGNLLNLYKHFDYNGQPLRTVVLTGLTPNTWYDVRLYEKQWDTGVGRTFSVGYDVGNDGSVEYTSPTIDQNHPESTAALSALGIGQQSAWVQSYVYQTGPAQTSIALNLTNNGSGGSYHFYGISNQRASVGGGINRLPASTTLRIVSSGLVNLSSTNTVQYLYIDGVGKAAGTWGSATSGAAHPDSHFTGNGVLVVSSAVVTAPPAAQLVFSSAPVSPWANLPFNVTVQTVDTNGAVEPVTSDTTVQLGVASGSGSLSGTTSGVIYSNSSSVTLSAVLYSAGDLLTLQAATTAGMSLASGSTNIAFQALGYTSATNDGGYDVVITFTDGIGVWTPPAGVSNVEVLVVGGGGGGGARRAGGGGAGGLIYSNNFAVTAGSPVAVTVGAGGQGGVYTGAAATSGADSVFSTLTAIGGGFGGGAWNSGANSANGANAGSGGGASYDTPNKSAGSGTAGQGNNGGATGGFAGGGGGGAGAIGGTGNYYGGAGGTGVTNSITGTATAYAGGGGGGANDNDYPAANQVGGAGGSGVGGKGADGANGTAAGVGIANTGGGGGGGAMSGHTYPDGAAGGSGVVIVKYIVPGATPPVPTQLAFTTVPASATAQQAFSVTVTAQDASGYAMNVTNDTTVQLSVASGSGAVSGTTSGVISNGTSSVTISGVIYSMWDTATLGAATTSGMSLTPAVSTAIAFVQPASVAVGSDGQYQGLVVNVGPAYSVTFNTGVTAPEFGGLSGAGSLVLTDAVGSCVSLLVGGSGPDTEFDGVLSGCGGLTKVGANQFTLTANNTYLGGTVVSNGTLTLVGPLPGLYEGEVCANLSDTDPNYLLDAVDTIPHTSVQLSDRMANTGNGWTGGTTWGYSGYFNNPYSTDVYYYFGKSFDDSGFISIDGTVVISNTAWGSFTTGAMTLSPGWHSIELRVGQGTGGVGPNGDMKDNGVNIGLGWSTDGGTTWHAFADPGDGSVLLAKSATGNILPTTTTLRIETPGVVNLLGGSNTVQALYIDGTQQATGTWGSSTAGVDHPDDLHFTGNGILVVGAAGIAVTATITLDPGSGNYLISATTSPATTGLSLKLYKSNDLGLGMAGFTDTGAACVDDGGGNYHFFPTRIPGTGLNGDGTPSFYLVK